MIAEIVNHIKSRLGTTHRRIELDDRDIVRLLQDETLKTMSIYHPFFLEYLLDTETTLVEGMGNTYNLPLEIEGFRLIGVEKVFTAASSPAAMAPAAFGLLGTSLEQALTNFANLKLMQGITTVMLPPETFQFIPPGLLRIFNIYTNKNVFVVLKTTHKKDFSTFNFGLLETIKKLALADVANDLLGIRSYFQNIGTPFAEINLNIDDLKDWSSKRDDIIDTMRKNMLKNAGVRKIYVA